MRRYASVSVPAGLLVSAASAAAAQPAQGSSNWHYGWGWDHMLFGSLMMVVFWGGIIAVVVLAVRWLGTGSSGMTPPQSRDRALDQLKERFARGEIDREDFEERKRLLSE